MIAQGAAEIPWAENTLKPEQHEPSPQPPRPFSTGTIKRLFREALKLLTGRTAAPRPKRRRKRGEDTRGLFKKLAMRILAPVVRSIFDYEDFNCFTSPDELDETQRRMQREWRSQDVWQQHDNEAFRYDQQNHLFPHL